jgi:hypothetical protein
VSEPMSDARLEELKSKSADGLNSYDAWELCREIRRLRAENAELTEANHSVAVCSTHTQEITRCEYFVNGCLVCENEWWRRLND